ncbi:hypothetical protein TNCV_1904281, partial [Trichonephila clavipes]
IPSFVISISQRRPRTCELHDLSNHHERIKRLYGTFAVKFDLTVSACAKLRDTVTGISALHLSIHGMDGRSPSPGNSFMDMYISGKQAMIRRKAEMLKSLSISKYNRVPTAASPTSQPKRKTAKRQPASPSKQTPLKKQAKSERKLPSTSTSPRHIEGAESSMEEGETSAEESSDEVSSKPVKPVIAPRSPAAKAAGKR